MLLVFSAALISGKGCKKLYILQIRTWTSREKCGLISEVAKQWDRLFQSKNQIMKYLKDVLFDYSRVQELYPVGK